MGSMKIGLDLIQSEGAGVEVRAIEKTGFNPVRGG